MNIKGVRRTGGRKKGTPNKATIAAQIIAESDAQVIKTRPKAAMLTIMELYLGMASRYQPGTRDKPNAQFNEQKFEKYTQLALDAAHKAAPYYDARLAHTTLQTTDNKPLMSRLEVVFVDPPKHQQAAQLLAAMNGNGHDRDHPTGL